MRVTGRPLAEQQACVDRDKELPGQNVRTGQAVGLVTASRFRRHFTYGHRPEERNELVDGRKADENINDPSQGGVLAAEEGCHEVELECADEQPVHAAYDDE